MDLASALIFAVLTLLDCYGKKRPALTLKVCSWRGVCRRVFGGKLESM